MPKDDDRLKKAVAMDDNVEGGSYLIMDDNDNVRIIQGTILGKKSSIYDKIMQPNGTNQENSLNLEGNLSLL